MDPPPRFSFDVFVSRRGPVAAVAQEVATVLEAEGLRVTVQDYDAVLGGIFPLFIHDALVQARNLIVLHSADYDTNHWTRQEFSHFLAAPDRSAADRRIGVLRCDAAEPRGLLAGLVYGDLHSVTDPAERRRIILKVARGEAPVDRPATAVFGGATMPLENPLFTGREAELVAVHAALSAGTAPAALTQAAVHGLGGVGKTSLARAYVARLGPVYGGVWWLRAADRLGIQTGLGDLARRMDPKLPTDAKLDAAASRALELLAQRDGAPFLLVFDNVERPEALDGLLPPRGAQVLITSRASGWGGRARAVTVDTLPEDAATDFLQRRAERTDAAGAAVLARALGCLPLALDHAGAYVNQAGIDFAAYTRRIGALLHRPPPPGAVYPVSVAATFTLAIERAARDSADAERLLGLFAWLGAEAIPLALADAAIPDEAARDDAVMTLRSVSLLASAPDGACGPAVSVHRLVATVMRARLAAQRMAEAVREAALVAVEGVFPGGAYRDPTVWPRCRTLLPLVGALLDYGGDAASVALADLCDKAGSYLDRSGTSAEAEGFFRRALATRERMLGAEHPATLTSVNNLALCLHARGDLAAAEPLYRRALAASERVQGAEHPNTLSSVNNLALCLRAKGDLPGAEPLHHRALAACERVLGADHPNTLSSVNNLAICLQAKGDLAAAELLFRRALAAREHVLGAEHPDTLGTVNNLAECLRAKGDLAAAEPLYRRALAIQELVLGVEHPDTLGSVNNLALCLQARGDLAAAEPLFRRALGGMERVLGEKHPGTLTNVNNLAQCLRAKGDLAEAEPLFRHALAAQECVLGAEHPDTLISVNNLAGCLQAKGDLAAAEPLYRRALAVRELVLGAEHPDTLISVNNLAGCLNAKGDLAASESLYRRALVAQERVLGAEHPATLASLNNLAGCLQAKGDLAAAEPLYRRALAGAERVLGPDHPNTVLIRDGIARLTGGGA